MSARLDPHLEAGWLALVLGAALLPPGPSRRLCGAGLGILGLGLAAWRAGPDTVPLPTDFVAINGGLLLLGIGCTVLAAWWGASASRRGYLAAAAVAVGVVILGAPMVGFLTSAPPAMTTAVLTALAAGGVLLGLVAARLRLRWTRPRPEPPARPALHWLALLLAGALGAGLGRHLAVVFLGGVAAAVAGWRLGLERAGRSFPLVPILVVGAVAPAYRLFAVIAGDEGLGLRTLSDLPLSPAAESLLAPAVLLAAWALTGLWPLLPRMPAGLTGPVGLLLAARVALPALPAGLEHWRPVAFPILLLGLWQATAAERWPALASGAALLGLVSGSPEGVSGAGWLAGAGVALELSAWLSRSSRAAASAVAGGAILLAGWGSFPVLVAGLGAEVVYTAFAAAGVALALAPDRSTEVTKVR